MGQNTELIIYIDYLISQPLTSSFYQLLQVKLCLSSFLIGS